MSLVEIVKWRGGYCGASVRSKYFLLISWLLLMVCPVRAQQEPYLNWTASQAEQIGKSMRANGTVGGAFDFRVIHMEHSYNYKLRATLLTPEVIRGAARLEQLRLRLTDEQTRALVEEAESAAQMVILVEIDPREGSGVIPLDWRAVIQPKGLKDGQPGPIVGIRDPKLKGVKALAGVARRDYSYDIFWVVFPLVGQGGERLIPDAVREIELLVGIYNKQGKVGWVVPDSIRSRARDLAQHQ